MRDDAIKPALDGGLPIGELGVVRWVRWVRSGGVVFVYIIQNRMYAARIVVITVEHNFVGSNRIWFYKLLRRSVGKGASHKFVPHWSCSREPSALFGHRSVVVITGPYAGYKRVRPMSQPSRFSCVVPVLAAVGLSGSKRLLWRILGCGHYYRKECRTNLAI